MAMTTKTTQMMARDESDGDENADNDGNKQKEDERLEQTQV